tara:strand:- start:3640 stop:4203 length:564 start_codon:yes stop_codon:yes gene_type:complete
MSVIEQIQTMKTLVKTNKTLFNSEMQMQHPRKGAIKWVATPDNLENIYGNLKRSIRSKTPLIELEKLFKSIEQNKFATQIKEFSRYYTNAYGSASDINLGSCPKIDNKIPQNIHKHTKEYFVLLILNWYDKYYTWRINIDTVKLETKKQDEVKICEKEIAEEVSPIKESEETVVLSNDNIPDSWEDM